jgi:peptide/nickel transport system substrate-binding protein
MSDREHVWIPKLKQQLEKEQISRREFVKYATLLGMSAGLAYSYVGDVDGGAFTSVARADELPKGGVLRLGMRVPKLDSPHTFALIFDSNFTRQVCGHLTRTGADGITRPALASGWKASDDLKTWTFTISDVSWHDGRPLTAEDVAWNIRRCLDPKVGSSVIGLMKGYMLNDVDTGEKDSAGNPVMSTQIWDSNAIEVKDSKTLVLNLKEPQVAIPEHLFHYPLFILDPKEDGVFRVGSNGNGAFTMTELEVGRRAVFKAVEGRGAHLDGIEILDFGDNPSAVTAALASKQIDGIYQGNPEQMDIFKGLDHLKIYDVVTADTAVARMQMTAKPFNDARVRKALRLATDPAKTLAIAQRGMGAPAEHHHVSPVHPDYKKLPPMTRDVQASKKLLAEAGYPDGIDISIDCKPDPAWEQAAVEAMVEQWREAGIRCKINLMPSAKYWEIWTKTPFGFTMWAHRPLGFMVLALAYRTGVPWNESQYSNAEFDEVLTRAEGTLDVDKRRELIGRLEEIMQEDGPIVQPLWRTVFAAYDKKVKGFAMHPSTYIFCENLAIEQ